MRPKHHNFFVLFILLISCSTKEKYSLCFDKETNLSSPVDYYFYASLKKTEGFCKFTEIQGNVLLNFQVTVSLDTSSNKSYQSLFLSDTILVTDTAAIREREDRAKAQHLKKIAIIDKSTPDIDQSFREGSFPFLYKTPILTSRIPSFMIDLEFHFRDKDNIELYSIVSHQDFSNSMPVIDSLVEGSYLIKTQKRE